MFIDFHVTFGSEKDVISLPSENLSLESLYSQISEEFKIAEDFSLQHYMMKWNDWVRLKNINVIKHGGKLNVIFSQSPLHKENEIKRVSVGSSLTTHRQIKQINKVMASPRSKLHASIDRIKRLSVPSCDGESMGSASPTISFVRSSPSTSPLETNLSSSFIQQDTSLTHFTQNDPLFPSVQTHLTTKPQIHITVKSEPENVYPEFETSCDSFSNSTLDDASVTGKMCTRGKHQPYGQNTSKTKIQEHDLYSQHESLFPTRTTNQFGFAHSSYISAFSVSPHQSSTNPNKVKAACSSTSSSSMSDTLALTTQAMTTNIFRDQSMISTKLLPTQRQPSVSGRSLLDHTSTMFRDQSTPASVKFPLESRHSSGFEETQPFKLTAKLKDTSTSPSAWPDMYDIPDREISWSIREKLMNGEKLPDSDRIRLMDVIYNHVTKFTFYPSTMQYSLIVDSFLKKFPSVALTERGNTADIAELWKKRLKRKFQNVRARRDSRVPCVQRQKIGKRPSKCFQMTSSFRNDSCWHFSPTDVNSDSTQPTVHHEDRYETSYAQPNVHQVEIEEETDMNTSDDN